PSLTVRTTVRTICGFVSGSDSSRFPSCRGSSEDVAGMTICLCFVVLCPGWGFLLIAVLCSSKHDERLILQQASYGASKTSGASPLDRKPSANSSPLGACLSKERNAVL